MSSFFRFQVGDIVECIDNGELSEAFKRVLKLGSLLVIKEIDFLGFGMDYVRISINSDPFWLYSYRLRLVGRQFKWGSIIVISSSDQEI
jgi:hypothetical protein